MSIPTVQELDECLKDKCGGCSHNDVNDCVGNGHFQSLPDFAETVAFLHQFGALFGLSSFSFTDLAQALHQLGHQQQHHKHSLQPNQQQLLDNLFAEILHYCGYKFDRSTLYKCLRKLIRRVNQWTTTPFDADLLCRSKQAAPATASAEMETKREGGEENSNNTNQERCKSEAVPSGGEDPDQVRADHKPDKAWSSGAKSGYAHHSFPIEEQQPTNGFDILPSPASSSVMSLEQQIRTDCQNNNDDDARPPSSSSIPSQDSSHGAVEAADTAAALPELANLSAAQALQLIVHLMDYLLQCVHEDGELDPKFPDDQLHLRPLCVDPAGRKFWHFPGDTWLFMEQGRPAWMDAGQKETKARQQRHHSDVKKEENEEQPDESIDGTPRRNARRQRPRHIRTVFDKKKKRRSGAKKEGEAVTKRGGRQRQKSDEEAEEEEKETEADEQQQIDIVRQETDQACVYLFTGTHFRPICTCSDHFVALINAYRAQPTDVEAHKEVAERLEQCLQDVRSIEQERHRQAAEREREQRINSRVVALMEKRRVEAEQMRLRQQRISEAKRRLAEEEFELLREHRCLTDSDLRPNMSREDRHRLRQQRADELRERDQMVAAGLLPADENDHCRPYDNDMEEEDDDDADADWWKSVMVDGDNDSHGHHRSGSRGGRRLLPISRPVRVRTARCRMWRWAPEAPVPSKIASFAKQSPLSLASYASSSSSTRRSSAPSSKGTAASFCLLMDEQQLPAAVKRKMSSFMAECSSSSVSSSLLSSSSFGGAATATTTPPSAAISTTSSSTVFSMFNNYNSISGDGTLLYGRTRSAAATMASPNLWGSGENGGKALTLFAPPPTNVTANCAIRSIRSVLQLPGAGGK